MAVYYILLFGIIVFGILLCDFIPMEKTKKVYCILAAIGLSAISGLRFMVSTDYGNYWEAFLQSNYWDWNEFSYQRMEKGYLSVNRLLTNITLGHNILFVVFAILFGVSIALYIYKYSSNVWVSFFSFVALGFLYNSMCFLRQYTAMLIIMWALKYVEKKHFFRFMIFVLFATTFHLSAIIMIPFYFILRIPMNKVVTSVYLLICGVLFIESDYAVALVTKVFYKKYGASNEMIHGTSPGPCIGFLVLLFICLVLYKQLVKQRKFNSLLINLLYWGTFFELIGIKHAIISRIALLFMTPAVILLVAELSKLFIKKMQKTKWGIKQPFASVVVAYFILLTPLFVFHQHLLSIDYNGVVPYQSVFSEEFQKY